MGTMNATVQNMYSQDQNINKQAPAERK